jgi:hypothetical protein
MNNSKIDVAVLLIFFSRPGCFSKVFEQVRMARPSKLFLYQDGPREGNESDIRGIAACRKIAMNIDWECEVHQFYQEKNIGCDPSEYIAQNWAFQHVDKCIILEDDDVPSQSFFPFCKELLDKYENDERINMICGMNNLESVESPYSYLFTVSGSIWGWATWKRVVDSWESDYAFLDPGYDRDKLFDTLRLRKMHPEKRAVIWQKNRDSKVEHYETILGLGQYVNNRLNIVPTMNMILNIGNTPEGGTHSANGIQTIPKGLRRIFEMRTYDINFPLKHPKYVIEDHDYQKRLFRVMGWGHPFVNLFRQFEKGMLILVNEGLDSFFHKIRKKHAL